MCTVKLKLAYFSKFHSSFLSGLDDDVTLPYLITSSSFLTPSASRNSILAQEHKKVRRTPHSCTQPGNVLSTMFTIGNPYKRMPISYKDKKGLTCSFLQYLFLLISTYHVKYRETWTTSIRATSSFATILLNMVLPICLGNISGDFIKRHSTVLYSKDIEQI